MVSGRWELRWGLWYPEVHPAPKKPKPFLGIGPDDMRMARGNVLPFPYNANGTINRVYYMEVDKLERHKKSISEILSNPLPIAALKAFRDAMQSITAARLHQMEQRLLRDALKAVRGGNK